MRPASIQNAILFALIGGGLFIAWRAGMLRFRRPAALPNYSPLVPNSPARKPEPVTATGGDALRVTLLPFMAKAELSNGLPAGLLDKIAIAESNYRADIVNGKTVSNKGAVGLMQIVPAMHPTAKPLDPIASVAYAGKYLGSLYKRFGDWPRAVAAYNWGQGNVASLGLKAAPAETKNYVMKVLGVSIA